MNKKTKANVKKVDKSNKNKRPVIILGIVIFSLISFIIYKALKPKPKHYQNGLPVELVVVEHLYDTSTKEKAIGLSDYTFVGKINKHLRTEHIEIINDDKSKEYIPHSVYSVTVLKNIKGKLITEENIEVAFIGGLRKDEKYFYQVNGLMLPKEGAYYILLPVIHYENGQLTIESKDQRVRLDGEYKEKEKNEVVESYINAYKYQIIPDEGTYMEPKQYYQSKYDVELYNKNK